MAISKDILDRETDARFWAQTGYRPGQKLDPSSPTDKAMMPVWMDVYRKVKAEADAGTLVTTFDHPEVAQHLADADVANRAAAAHLDAAVAAPDPATAQQNVVAATTAAQISAQKARDAAATQPPTVSSQLLQGAARDAAQNPPPPNAPSADHLAHAQTQAPPTPKPPQPPRDVLFRETDLRFWNTTHYKPGKKLDMSDPQDREIAKVWREIFRQVQREANQGTLVLTPPPAATPLAPPPPAPTPPPPPFMPPRAAPPARPPMRMPPMPPFRPPMGPPMMIPPGMAPLTHPSMMPPGMAPPTHPMVPPSATVPGAPPAAGPPAEMPPPGPEVGPPPELPATGMSNTAKIALVVLGVAAAGGIAYAATRKPPRSPSRPRARLPRVIVATPTTSPALAIRSPRAART